MNFVKVKGNLSIDAVSVAFAEHGGAQRGDGVCGSRAARNAGERRTADQRRANTDRDEVRDESRKERHEMRAEGEVYPREACGGRGGGHISGGRAMAASRPNGEYPA